MEIERKWLFNSIDAPENSGAVLKEESMYKQGYLSINPEVRVRSKRLIDSFSPNYRLCIKGKGTVSRIEIERDIDYAEFVQLTSVGNFAEDDMILKHMKHYALGNHHLTICHVDAGTSHEFIYGEIEFETIDDAINFNPPEWFGVDVTSNLDYKMCNYWAKTRLNK